LSLFSSGIFPIAGHKGYYREQFSLYRSGVVAIIGPPNAGKSTLLNQLLQTKDRHCHSQAADHAKPDHGHCQWRRVSDDSPGYPRLHEAQRGDEPADGAGRSSKVLNEADVAFFLADSTDMAAKKLERRAEEFKKYLDRITCPVVLALNKRDLLPYRKGCCR
jgi:GTPase